MIQCMNKNQEFSNGFEIPFHYYAISNALLGVIDSLSNSRFISSSIILAMKTSRMINS